MNLTPTDIAILRALSAGRLPAVSPQYRQRLDLLGLVQEGPDGLRLTAAGEVAARQKPTVEAEPEPTRRRDDDKLGRRRAGSRRAPI